MWIFAFQNYFLLKLTLFNIEQNYSYKVTSDHVDNPEHQIEDRQSQVSDIFERVTRGQKNKLNYLNSAQNKLSSLSHSSIGGNFKSVNNQNDAFSRIMEQSREDEMSSYSRSRQGNLWTFKG